MTNSLPATKVLVVDDEPDLVSLLQEWLEGEGYEVYCAYNGKDALRLLFQHRPSLCVTDLRMAGMDGFELISRIREISDVHVLVLSAMGGEDQMVRGLELGADEYLVKPVSKRLFLARVRSLLRRATNSEGSVPDGYSDNYLTINFLTHQVRVLDKDLHLRPTEFRLLTVLTRNCDRVIRHQELLDLVWGDMAGSLDSLKWYISALREKLRDSDDPRLIVTVPRVGYRYSPPNSHQEN